MLLEQAHKLTVTGVTDKGTYIDAKEHGSVFLRKAPDTIQVGDKVNAFLYRDSNGRNEVEAIFLDDKIARSKVGECAFLNVVSEGEYGAFLDWGMPKDLLLPYSEQDFPVREGSSYVVYIRTDDKDRPLASTLLHHYLDEDGSGFRKGDQVELLIASKSELGFKAVINNAYLGLIFHEDLSQPLSLGSRMKGWIKQIREDGKIDLTINTLDKKTRDQLEQKILNKLKQEGGRLMLSDKSSPEVIFKMFKVSKRNFKRALGGLYKQKLIKIEASYIELT